MKHGSKIVFFVLGLAVCMVPLASAQQQTPAAVHLTADQMKQLRQDRQEIQQLRQEMNLLGAKLKMFTSQTQLVRERMLSIQEKIKMDSERIHNLRHSGN